VCAAGDRQCDDFGLTSGVNLGIIEANENGIITAASLMVRGDASAQPATYAREHAAALRRTLGVVLRGQSDKIHHCGSFHGHASTGKSIPDNLSCRLDIELCRF
jgi:YdjC-like protein